MATILGLDRGEGQHFTEIASAVTALTPRAIYFMAHAHPAPPGGIVYHWENGPLAHHANMNAAKEIWDFSLTNLRKYAPPYAVKARHVPCGYHPAMERFQPAANPTYDVAFMGCMNPRRDRIFTALRQHGLSIIISPHFGAARDAQIASAKVLLNLRYYDDGVFPVLRSAHAAANRMPCISEISPEIPDWATYRCGYNELVARTVALVRALPAERTRVALETYEAFRRSPLRLP